jgi:hypothetical protein
VLGEGQWYFSESQLNCCEVSDVDHCNDGDDDNNNNNNNNRSASHYTPASLSPSLCLLIYYCIQSYWYPVSGTNSFSRRALLLAVNSQLISALIITVCSRHTNNTVCVCSVCCVVPLRTQHILSCVGPCGFRNGAARCFTSQLYCAMPLSCYCATFKCLYLRLLHGCDSSVVSATSYPLSIASITSHHPGRSRTFQNPTACISCLQKL